MSQRRTLAVLIHGQDDEPLLSVLQSDRSINRAVAAGQVVMGIDGRRILPAEEKRFEGDDTADQERLEQAHRALLERIGAPDPGLPDAAAHVAALGYLATLWPALIGPTSKKHKPLHPKKDGEGPGDNERPWCKICRGLGLPCPSDCP